jgi:hypothetical protein
MTLKMKIRSILRKTCHSVTLATKRSTVSALGLRPCFCGKKTATDRLCHRICPDTVTDAGKKTGKEFFNPYPTNVENRTSS